MRFDQLKKYLDTTTKDRIIGDTSSSWRYDREPTDDELLMTKRYGEHDPTRFHHRGCMSFTKNRQAGDGDIIIRPPDSYRESGYGFSKIQFNRFLEHVKTAEGIDDIDTDYTSMETRYPDDMPPMPRYFLMVLMRSLWINPRFIYVFNFYMSKGYTIYETCWLVSYSRDLWWGSGKNASGRAVTGIYWDFMPSLYPIGAKGSFDAWVDKLLPKWRGSQGVDAALQVGPRPRAEEYEAAKIINHSPFVGEGVDRQSMNDHKAIKLFLDEYKLEVEDGS